MYMYTVYTNEDNPHNPYNLCCTFQLYKLQYLSTWTRILLTHPVCSIHELQHTNTHHKETRATNKEYPSSSPFMQFITFTLSMLSKPR